MPRRAQAARHALPDVGAFLQPDRSDRRELVALDQRRVERGQVVGAQRAPAGGGRRPAPAPAGATPAMPGPRPTAESAWSIQACAVSGWWPAAGTAQPSIHISDRPSGQHEHGVERSPGQGHHPVEVGARAHREDQLAVPEPGHLVPREHVHVRLCRDEQRLGLQQRRVVVGVDVLAEGGQRRGDRLDRPRKQAHALERVAGEDLEEPGPVGGRAGAPGHGGSRSRTHRIGPEPTSGSWGRS